MQGFYTRVGPGQDQTAEDVSLSSDASSDID